MDKIIFVMGIPGAGKSTYIKENFKDKKIIDLYNFQQKISFFTFESIWDSYVELKDEIIKSIKNKEDIVVEHTLLRAERRKFYIDEIRKISDIPIEIILIKPSMDEQIKRLKNRYKRDDDEPIRNVILDNLTILEIPTIEEGFSKVTIIED